MDQKTARPSGGARLQLNAPLTSGSLILTQSISVTKKYLIIVFLQFRAGVVATESHQRKTYIHKYPRFQQAKLGNKIACCLCALDAFARLIIACFARGLLTRGSPLSPPPSPFPPLSSPRLSLSSPPRVFLSALCCCDGAAVAPVLVGTDSGPVAAE